MGKLLLVLLISFTLVGCDGIPVKLDINCGCPFEDGKIGTARGLSGEVYKDKDGNLRFDLPDDSGPWYKYRQNEHPNAHHNPKIVKNETTGERLMWDEAAGQWAPYATNDATGEAIYFDYARNVWTPVNTGVSNGLTDVVQPISSRVYTEGDITYEEFEYGNIRQDKQTGMFEYQKKDGMWYRARLRKEVIVPVVEVFDGSEWRAVPQHAAELAIEKAFQTHE
jgi:hypothetical protein